MWPAPQMSDFKDGASAMYPGSPGALAPRNFAEMEPIEGQPLGYERLSSSFPGNQLNAVKMNMPVGYQSELIAHEGAEFAYVLSGSIVYTIDGRSYPLGPGDSVHFDAGKPHCLRNAGEETAEVLTVTTMPLFGEHPGT